MKLFHKLYTLNILKKNAYFQFTNTRLMLPISTLLSIFLKLFVLTD